MQEDKDGTRRKRQLLLFNASGRPALLLMNGDKVLPVPAHSQHLRARIALTQPLRLGVSRLVQMVPAAPTPDPDES